jgi:hypothetical protein
VALLERLLLQHAAVVDVVQATHATASCMLPLLHNAPHAACRCVAAAMWRKPLPPHLHGC